MPSGRRARRRLEELEAQTPKATWFKNLYSKMHSGIVDHPVYIDEGNVEELRGMDFVFVCVDDGESKKLIVEKLEEFDVPFIDVGMGVQLNDEMLAGIVRVTTSTPERRDHFRRPGLLRGHRQQRVQPQYPDCRSERAERRPGRHQVEKAVRLLPGHEIGAS